MLASEVDPAAVVVKRRLITLVSSSDLMRLC